MDEMKSMPFSHRLKILKWLDDYPKLVAGIIQKPESFEKEKNKIMGEYVEVKAVREQSTLLTNQNFMISCCNNAIAQDLRKDTKLHATPSGCPFTPSVIELFTMLNTQLEEVIESKLNDVSVFLIFFSICVDFDHVNQYRSCNFETVPRSSFPNS